MFLIRDLEIKESNQPSPYVISSSGEHRTNQVPEKQAQLQVLPLPKQMSQSSTAVAFWQRFEVPEWLNT